MRLIDANILRDEFDPEDSMEYDAVGVRYIIDSAPTIDPIRAAGGCRCGKCKHLVDGAKCYTPLGARLPSGECIIVDVDDFCSHGEAREAQDDG